MLQDPDDVMGPGITSGFFIAHNGEVIKAIPLKDGFRILVEELNRANGNKDIALRELEKVFFRLRRKV